EQLAKEFENRLAQTDAEIQAVSTTLRLLKNGHEATGTLATKSLLIPASVFVGKTQRAALAEIAKRNGGIVKVGEARRILIDAGVIRDAKNTWGLLYTTMSRSPEFEKSGRGQFMLVDKSV